MNAGPGRRVDPAPVGTLAAVALAGLGALAARLTTVGTALLLLALAGVLAAALGPLRRRDAEVGDIVVPHPRGPDEEALLAEQRRLGDALGDPRRLESEVRPRVAATASARLARKGLQLTDPAARDLLGEPCWTWLTGPPRRRPLSAAQFADLLGGVEGLADRPAATGARR